MIKKILLLAALLPTIALAARDPSGNYTLPSGNPVVSGTKITANWANTTLNDIAAALSDSLSRSGKGGMQVPFYLSDGTEASPGISFSNEQGSGVYRNAAGDVRIAVQGKDALSLTQTTIHFGDSTSGGRWAVPLHFDAVLFFPGKMINGQLLARIGFTTASRFQAALPAIVTYVGTTGTGAVNITIKKRTAAGTVTDIGVLQWLAGGRNALAVTGTLATTDVDFAAGDFVEFHGPATADSTFADASITIKGRRL